MLDSHHYWTHFWCGFVFGLCAGAWLGWCLFDGGWALVVTVTVTASVVALCCGRWGDRAWHWILERLHWMG